MADNAARHDIRVLQIVADGSPGGGTTHVLQILRGLRGKCSFGLVTQRDSYMLDEARSLGIPSFGVDFFRSRLDPQVPLSLHRIAGEYGAQVVHLHGGRAAFFYALAFAGAPAVYTVHGYHFLPKKPILRWLALRAERLATRRARSLIFVSFHDARVAKDHGILRASTQSNVIHNGIPLREVKSPSSSSIRNIGFIGRLEIQKDPLLFLDVVECLPGYLVTIVGGGALEDEVRRQIRRRRLSGVRMLGALPHRDTLEVLSTLGVVVITSRWEGMPILPLEAMWAGVPVVATNVGALDEVIKDGRSGLLVDSRFPDDLAQAVRRVTSDPALRERIVREGRDRVRSRFSEERMLSRIFEVYRRVTEA
jgi:glycosyltransferase involved in cell wall biosynthesis